MSKHKRNVLKNAAVIILVGIAFIAISGCSQPEPSHLGVWQSNITEEITILIQDDGTLEEYWEDTLTATYSYEIEGNSLIVEQYDDKYTLTLDGDKLIYMDDVLYTKK